MGLFEGSQTVLQISENLSIAFSHPLHGRWAWLHSSPPLSLGSILCGRLEYSLCASYPNLATFCTFYLSSPECALWRLLTSGMAPDGPRVRPECTPCAHGPERAFPPLRVRHVRHVRHVRRVRSPIKKDTILIEGEEREAHLEDAGKRVSGLVGGGQMQRREASH